MRIYKALLGFTFAVCLMLTAPMAWADSDTGVESVRMIADVSQLEKGGSFLIGIEFKLLPHWHLYWSNPGEFGVAPEFEFEIPEGFSMGSLRWPTPMKFKQRKDILGYGYEETVMLSVPIQSNPADTLGRNPQFTAQVRWLACNLDRCVPGKQKVSHTISVRNDRILAYTQEFEAHARSLPLDDPSRDELVTITKQGTLKAGGAPAKFQISYDWKQSTEAIDWFPGTIPGLSVQFEKMETKNGVTLVEFLAAAGPQMSSNDASLNTILAIKASDGGRQGVRFLVPLH